MGGHRTKFCRVPQCTIRAILSWQQNWGDISTLFWLPGIVPEAKPRDGTYSGTLQNWCCAPYQLYYCEYFLVNSSKYGTFENWGWHIWLQAINQSQLIWCQSWIIYSPQNPCAELLGCTHRALIRAPRACLPVPSSQSRSQEEKLY